MLEASRPLQSRCEVVPRTVRACGFAEAVVGEEVHEREQRELIGIGEKQAAQRLDAPGDPLRRLALFEPLRDGLPGEAARDRAVPALLREFVVANQRPETAHQFFKVLVERLLGQPAAAIQAVVAEAAANDGHRLDAKSFASATAPAGPREIGAILGVLRRETPRMSTRARRRVARLETMTEAPRLELRSAGASTTRAATITLIF